MTSRWQEEAEKTFLNTLVEHTVPTTEVRMKYDRRTTKETLSIIYRHLSIAEEYRFRLYIDICLERVKKPPALQLLKNFPIFYATCRFITMFKRAVHRSLS
jgi:hypothetical protein